MARKNGEGKGNKTGAVRDALQQGITDNVAIIDFAREKHGVDILPKHLSVIKSALKKNESAKTGNGRRHKVKKAVEPGAQPAKSRVVDTLVAVSDLAKKVGGIEQLGELVNILSSVR